MDATTRAELDALRLRAYGPSADIADDPAALERLVALEELALPAVPTRPAQSEVCARPDPRAAERPTPATPSATLVDAGPFDARVVAILPAPGGRRSARRGWHLALVAAVAVVAVPLGLSAATRMPTDAVPATAAGSIPASVRESLAFAQHPDSETLITVRIDGSFGDYVDIPTGSDVPLFPVEGLMTWVEPLGDYYGWRLWIGGARGAIDDENCLLLDGQGTMRASCVAVDLKSQGALLLSIPFAEISPAERPEAMTADQSLGFWWGTDGIVKILLAPTPAA